MIGHPLHTTPAPPRGAMSVVSASRLVASRGSARTCAPGRRSALGGTDAPWSSSRRVARRRVRATRRARREPLSVALARDARRFGRGVGIRRDVSVTVSRHDGCDEPEAGGRAPPSGTSEGVDADDVDASSSSSTPNTDEPSSNLDARIWALALPAVASLLLDPLLGAVDTAFVGRIEGEGAAAALGGLAVSSTVFNFSFKLFNFLAVVTGPLVASQIAAAGSGRERGVLRRTARRL